jgi:tetratricopeptide (TPR) repeat protein
MLTLLPLLLAVSSPVPAPALDFSPSRGVQAVQKPEGPDDASYYFIVGRYLEGAGKVDEAIASFKKAIALDPAIAEPRAELAALYARQDKAPEAVSAAEDALKVDPKNKEANRILGSVLAALADQHQPVRPGDDVSAYAKRATTALEIARGDGTGDLTIDLALAKLYLDQDRPADAIPLLRRIVDEQPQYAEGSVLLAGALETAGQAGAAEETLKNLLQDQPEFFRGRVQLAELYDRERRWQQAADAWAAVQKGNPGNPEVSVRLASSLLNGGRPAEASDVLRGALKGQAGDLRLSFMLAQAQRDSGDLDSAEATARDLHAAHPEDSRTTYLLAQMLQARDRNQEVVDLLKPEIVRLRAANAKGPQVAMLLGVEGLALQQLHHYDEAIALFKDGVGLAADDPVRQVLLIQGYAAAGRAKEALAAAEQARRTFPEDTGVAYQLASALDKAGRQPDAERVLRDLIAHDPLDAGALNYLGYLMTERGDALDEAVGLIQRALKVEPDNPSFLDSLGWAYVQQGKLDLADPPLSTAAEKMPKNSVIQDHLGDLREKQNRRADAIAAWQRALAGDGDSIDRAKVRKKIDQVGKQ